MRKLFIIIVTFNPGENFVNLIENLKKQRKKLKKTSLKIIIVDNNSTDGSLEKLKPLNLFKLIKNKQNLGFAAGCNKGIKYSLKKGADYLLLLNQDIEIINDFINPLIISKADIVAPIIKFKRDNTWIQDFGGRVNWWLGRAKHIEKSSVISHQSSVIDYVSGCCMLVKREVFERIGFFDEAFFLYFEDVDFCLRAKKAGFKIAVEPSSFIIHYLLEKKQKSFFKQFHLLRSNLIFINKYQNKITRPIGCLYLFLLSLKIFFNYVRGK